MFVLLNGPVFYNDSIRRFYFNVCTKKRLRKEEECKTFLWYVRDYVSTFNLCLNDEIFSPFLY